MGQGRAAHSPSPLRGGMGWGCSVGRGHRISLSCAQAVSTSAEPQPTASALTPEGSAGKRLKGPIALPTLHRRQSLHPSSDPSDHLLPRGEKGKGETHHAATRPPIPERRRLPPLPSLQNLDTVARLVLGRRRRGRRRHHLPHGRIEGQEHHLAHRRQRHAADIEPPGTGQDDRSRLSGRTGSKQRSRHRGWCLVVQFPLWRG